MKISWKSFAQRRGITIDNFENMEYSDYASYCETRNVIPLPKEEFPKQDSKPKITKNPDVHLDIKSIKKFRKSRIEQICIENGVDLDGTETKSIMIDKLRATMNKQ